MKKVKNIKIIIILVMAAVIGYFVYSGMFTSAAVYENQERGPYAIAYMENNGKSDAGKQSKAIQNLLSTINKLNINTTKTISILYGNPAKIKKDNFRSISGFILENPKKEQVQSIKKIAKYRMLPKAPYITAEFHLRTKVSAYIAQTKIYVAIREYLEKKNLEISKIMKIYDRKMKKLQYCVTVKKKK